MIKACTVHANKIYTGTESILQFMDCTWGALWSQCEESPTGEEMHVEVAYRNCNVYMIGNIDLLSHNVNNGSVILHQSMVKYGWLLELVADCQISVKIRPNSYTGPACFKVSLCSDTLDGLKL